MSEDTTVLICGEVGKTMPLTGAITAYCFKCGVQVWVSVSGQKQIETDPTTATWCIKCLLDIAKKAAAEGEQIKFGMVNGAIEELQENV